MVVCTCNLSTKGQRQAEAPSSASLAYLLSYNLVRQQQYWCPKLFSVLGTYIHMYAHPYIHTCASVHTYTHRCMDA